MGFFGPSKAELAFDEVVRSCAKMATRLEAIPFRADEYDSVTRSRFGGVPYAEMGDTWPMHKNRPYDFVAQLNLRDNAEPPTTAYELITVFVCWYAIDHCEAIEMGGIVRSYSNPSPSKAFIMERPLPISDDDFRVSPCSIKSSSVLTYPSPVGSFLRVPEIARLNSDPATFHFKYMKSLKRIGYNPYDDRTQIGGYPTWVHDNTLDDDGLVFIAQIGYEPEAKNCIGDAAPVFIAAHRSDPTRFEVDSSQTH